MKKIVLILIGTTQLSLMGAASSSSCSSCDAIRKKMNHIWTLALSGCEKKIVAPHVIQDIRSRNTASGYYTGASDFSSNTPCPLQKNYITTRKSIVFFDTAEKDSLIPGYKENCSIYEYHLKDIISFMLIKLANNPTSNFILNIWIDELAKQSESLQEAFKNQNYPKVAALLFEQYEKNRNLEGCINALLPYAEQGDAFAMFELSRYYMQSYRESQKVDPLKLAIHWFTRATIRELQDISCHKKKDETVFCDSLSRIYYNLLTQHYSPSLFEASFKHYFQDNLNWLKTMLESKIENLPSPEWLYYYSNASLITSDEPCTTSDELCLHLERKEDWSRLRQQKYFDNGLQDCIFFRMTHMIYLSESLT